MPKEDFVFTASGYVKARAVRKGVQAESFQVPEPILITYSSGITHKIREGLHLVEKPRIYPYGIKPLWVNEVGLFQSDGAASGATVTLEELIACGCRKVLEIGTCGGLQLSTKVGDIIIVTEALSNEGTSLHYFPERLSFKASMRLLKEIKKLLPDAYVGSVWSTDGFYRETISEMLLLRQMGVLGVNMETSALFAVAEYYGIAVASIQIVSNCQFKEGLERYSPHPSNSIAKGLFKVVNALSQFKF